MRELVKLSMIPPEPIEIGEEVVMIPNHPVEKDDIIAENYLRSTKFCGSSKDGFMQEYVSLLPDRLVRLPEGIDKIVAAFTEIVSVQLSCNQQISEGFLIHADVTSSVYGETATWGISHRLLLKKMLPDSKSMYFWRKCE